LSFQLVTAQSITTIDQLEDLLSEPTPGVIETLGRIEGDMILLGVAGKMGPTLARMAKRASDAAGIRRRVIGVSRFTLRDQEALLQSHGIETIRCDLLDEEAINLLPEVPNVIYMVGFKFGTTGQEAATWAANSYLPGVVCRKFRQSKIVAFSTGNVYGLTPVTKGGSRETDVPIPVGEYAMSALGRERVFEYFSRSLKIPMAVIRLNYAAEPRYGVLVDLAQRVWAGQPVDLAMGYVNTIWQGDANAMTLQAFSHVSSPPCVVNVTGPEQLSVREVSERFGRLMNKKVNFVGTEGATALLSNAQKAFQMFGYPRVSAEELIRWIVEWVMRGGPTLGKPTHFESRDGKF
jgi:nucleoside-diphosphate-sugar epimerase